MARRLAQLSDRAQWQRACIFEGRRKAKISEDLMKLQPVAVGKMLPAALTLFASMALAQTSPTIIMETDPSITYTGTWYQNYETPNYGGESYLTNDKGATAVVTFNGTGITWVGVEDPYSGIAEVYLDGTPSMVDCYSGPTLYQQ